MRIPLSFFDLLIIIGMVTGTICSLLLFKKSKKKPANFFLGLGILGFVWLNTKTLLLSLDLWGIHGVGFFPNGIELALPPLFYFYFLSLIRPNFKFSRKDCLHFFPFFVAQLYAIVVYIATMQTTVYAEKQLIADSYHFTTIKSMEEYLMLLSTMIYFFLAYKPLQHYQNGILKSATKLPRSELGFLKNVVLGLLLISIYTMVNLILSQLLQQPYHWRWQLSHLMIATLVYYMGLVGYKNSDLNLPADYKKRSKTAKKPQELVDLKVITKLKNAIEVEQVYLNPKLNLQVLAKRLEVNEAVLSNNINAHYQKNFRSFINEVRVAEVKKRLLKEGLSHLSLLGLAKECGFNSEASFYRIFKSLTGKTPKQFLEENPTLEK